MKIAVVGGRDFEDYNKMQRVIESYFDDNIELWDRKNVIFVSGGAKGADSLMEKFAKKFDYNTLIFKPDWNLYGKSAGFVRNRKIIQNSDVVFAFWDGKSKGTKNSIDIAKELGKGLYIIKYSIEKRIDF
jgi:uncharacterized phage-like protein YoqJ